MSTQECTNRTDVGQLPKYHGVERVLISTRALDYQSTPTAHKPYVLEHGLAECGVLDPNSSVAIAVGSDRLEELDAEPCGRCFGGEQP